MIIKDNDNNDNDNDSDNDNDNDDNLRELGGNYRHPGDARVRSRVGTGSRVVGNGRQISPNFGAVGINRLNKETCPRGPPKSALAIVESVRKKRPRTRWDPAPPTAPKPIATRDFQSSPSA